MYDGLIDRVLSNLDRLDLSFEKDKYVAGAAPAAQQEDTEATTDCQWG